MVVDLADDDMGWDIFCQQQHHQQQQQPQHQARNYVERWGSQQQQQQQHWEQGQPQQQRRQQQWQHPQLQQQWQRQEQKPQQQQQQWLQQQHEPMPQAADMGKLDKQQLLGERVLALSGLWSDDDDDDAALCVEVLDQEEDDAAACKTQLVAMDEGGAALGAEGTAPGKPTAAAATATAAREQYQEQGMQQQQEEGAEEEEDQWEEAFAAADAAEAAAIAKRAAQELQHNAGAPKPASLLQHMPLAASSHSCQTSPVDYGISSDAVAQSQGGAMEEEEGLPERPDSSYLGEEPTGSCLLDLLLADELDDVTCQLVFDCAMEGEGGEQAAWVVDDMEVDGEMQEGAEQRILEEQGVGIHGAAADRELKVDEEVGGAIEQQQQQLQGAAVRGDAAAPSAVVVSAQSSDPAAAAVAAARQKRKLLYQRFIRQALQGGRSGTGGGNSSSSSSLQSLMQLIGRVIKQRAARGQGQLDLKGLLKEVQQEHVNSFSRRQRGAAGSCSKQVPECAQQQQHLPRDCGGLQQDDRHGSGCAARGSTAACGTVGRPGLGDSVHMGEVAAGEVAAAGVLPPQRLFVALLNLAHQNNLAVATAAGQARKQMFVAAQQKDGESSAGTSKGSRRGLQPAAVAEGHKAGTGNGSSEGGEAEAAEGPGSTCVAWIPETMICLAPGQGAQGDANRKEAHGSCNILC